MDASWTENTKYYFYRKLYIFLIVITLSKTYYFSYKRASNEYLKVENVFFKHINEP